MIVNVLLDEPRIEALISLLRGIPSPESLHDQTRMTAFTL